MLRILGSKKVFCDGLTRRDLLHVGALGPFGLSLEGWSRPHRRPRPHPVGGPGRVRSELRA